MKINADYLKALQQVAEPKKPEIAGNGAASAGFEEQLMLALNGSESPAGMAPDALAPREPGVAALSLDTLVDGASAQRENGYPALMDEFSRVLDNLDTYAGAIGSTGAVDLKSAYAALEDVSNALSGLRERAASENRLPDAFASMLNELEVMTVTEQFKLNRGDYM